MKRGPGIKVKEPYYTPKSERELFERNLQATRMAGSGPLKPNGQFSKAAMAPFLKDSPHVKPAGEEETA